MNCNELPTYVTCTYIVKFMKRYKLVLYMVMMIYAHPMF